MPWHEGAMWKFTKVVAWTQDEARAKLIEQLKGYGRTKEELDAIDIRNPIVDYQAEGNECWIQSIR